MVVYCWQPGHMVSYKANANLCKQLHDVPGSPGIKKGCTRWFGDFVRHFGLCALIVFLAIPQSSSCLCVLSIRGARW